MIESWYDLPAEDALKRLKSSPAGLSADEAAKRLVKYGPNALPREHADGWVKILVRQIANPFFLILTAAAAVSVWSGEATDAVVIVAAIVLNAVLGFVQEYKAGKAMDRLRNLVDPEARVRRAGVERTISAAALVPGDVLLLESGARISADARLIRAAAFETNEATLTGESLPIPKSPDVVAASTPLAERTDMVYAGSFVAAGRAEAVVVATGLGTELGAIAKLVSGTKEGETPLQGRLKALVRFLSIIILLLVAGLFGLGVAAGAAIAVMLATAVAVAVAAIPEGLPMSVTVILTVGARRMLHANALVRRLDAVETLGSVSVICTDKTGTLTEGNMRVTELVLSSGRVAITDIRTFDAPLLRVLEAGLLCNDAVVDASKGTVVRGTPTERALAEAALAAGVDYVALLASHPRAGELPFDSRRKYMATVHLVGGARQLFAKGSPERVLALCGSFAKDGTETPLTPARRSTFETLAETLAGEGLRVMALASGSWAGEQDPTPAELEKTPLTLLGFVALKDPLRKEAAAQVADAAAAGIRTILVTGDHPRTARSIAEAVGLARHTDVITAVELDAWDDAELDRRAATVDVFARVEPRHKIRLVESLQRSGDVVAMVGDGVNDSPALKAADVGVALGSGTDVARQASDLVLLDDNLGVITAAVREGRVIFDNIRKSATYLLASGFSELVLIAGALIMGLPIPLYPAQILWINLVADTLPNIGLVFEPGEKDVMRLKPRRREEPIFSRRLRFIVFGVGLGVDLVFLAVYVRMHNAGVSSDVLSSFFFLTIGVASMVYAFALKSLRHPFWKSRPFSNPWLLGGVLGGTIIMILPYVIPSLGVALKASSIPSSFVPLLIFLSILKPVAIEIVKVVRRAPVA